MPPRATELHMGTSTQTDSLLRGSHALSLYKLTIDQAGRFLAQAADNVPALNFVHYSQFKYGQRQFAQRYGIQLAELLSPHLQAMREPIVVLGTPYKRLPNAARQLAITVEQQLRAQGLPTSYNYIYQHRLADGDYSRLGAAERDARNQLKKRLIDPDDFAGKHVVVIDDVKITGSIERSITTTLDGMHYLSLTFANLLTLDPSLALDQPHLESELNHTAMHSLTDLRALMAERSNFALTTRAVKYVLESDPAHIRLFLDTLEDDQLRDLYEGIVDDGYDQMPRYDQSFKLVRAAYNPNHSN